MTRLHLLLIVLLVGLGSVACAPSATPVPTPDAVATETRIASNIYATQTASVPTATKTPLVTDTPLPTDTALPTDTLVPKPTATPVVSDVVVTSTLSSGWVLYEAQTAGFSLTLPPNWTQLDLSPTGLSNGLAVVGELNPNISSLLNSQTLRNLIASGLKFYAVDLDPQALAGGFPTTANVLQVDIGAAIPLDSLVTLTVDQVKASADPAAPLTHKRVTLSGIDAEELNYGQKLTVQAGTPLLTTVTQYLIVAGTHETVISFVGPRSLSDTLTPIFEESGQSFRFLK